jgi:hypothetical protein
MKDIVETFKILGHLATQMDMMMSVARKTYTHGDAMDTVIHMEGWFADQRYSKLLLTINLNHLIIFANSYLDEFERYLTISNYPDHKDQILAYKRVISTALKRVEKWKYLKDYKNELLVHNLRVKDRSIFAADHQPLVIRSLH